MDIPVNPVMEKTIEELLDFMYTTREEMRELDAQKTDRQKAYDEAEYFLIQKMEESGLKAAGIDKCSCTIKSEAYPQIKDMEGFVAWCADNNRADMLQKRVSKKSFDEYFEQTAEYPEGIDTYDKVTVLLRKR